MKKIKVMGICGGIGSCLYTFHNRNNFTVIGNIEPRAIFHDKNNLQWDLNFGDIPLERSITKSVKKLKPDIIIGHPDCGDSSILRMSRAKKKGNIKTNSSVNLFLNSINHYLPSIFLLENLPAFLESHPVESLSDIFFGRYKIFAIQGSVSLWGNSQVSRNRLVLVGVKESNKVNGLDNQKLIHILNQYHRQGRFHKHGVFHPKSSEFFELGWEEQPEIAHYRELPTTFVSLYHPPTNRRKITVKEAASLWKSLDPQISRWPVGGKMKNQPGVSRNIPSKPPLTVRKQNRQFSFSGWPLSPREMANIQGFPLSFRLYVDLGQRVYWLNKNRAAVTKCPPYEISLWLKRIIKQALV